MFRMTGLVDRSMVIFVRHTHQSSFGNARLLVGHHSPQRAQSYALHTRKFTSKQNVSRSHRKCPIQRVLLPSASATSAHQQRRTGCRLSQERTYTASAFCPKDLVVSKRMDLIQTLPKRIILMRHGESLGNADETLYAEIPDWKIPLTRRGERQSEKAARDLHELIQGESLFCYCSPYKRTKESWNFLHQHLVEKGDVNLIGMREEPRIAEQQFGNFQNPKKVRTAKAERRTFGRFFFRFPNGEAGLDVYNRVSSFLATLSRDLHQFHDAGADLSNLNILIVTHGLTLRLLLMRYFQLSVDEFEQSWNSQNAKLVVMDRIIPEGDESGTLLGGADPFKDVNLDSSQPSSLEGPRKPFFRLDEAAKEALNLRGDVSSEKPIFFRSDSFLDPKMPHDSEA